MKQQHNMFPSKICTRNVHLCVPIKAFNVHEEKKMCYILQSDFIMSGKTWASTDGCVCMRRPRSSSFTGKKINMKQSYLIAIRELVLFTSASSSSQVAPLYDVTMLNDASLICIKSLPGKAGYLFIFFIYEENLPNFAFASQLTFYENTCGPEMSKNTTARRGGELL